MGLTIAQLGIGFFGSVSFLLVISEDRSRQKLGVIFGLISNPFWWAMVILTGQWITIPVHALYTYGWLSKAWRLWGRPTETETERRENEAAWRGYKRWVASLGTPEKGKYPRTIYCRVEGIAATVAFILGMFALVLYAAFMFYMAMTR